MRNVVARPNIAAIANLPSLYNPKDLALIRRTVAADTSDDEFALFIHWARSLRLDPLRRQVHAFVFNKGDPKKRRLTLVTSIEGFRAIAARTGNYRPDENEPAFVVDEVLKSDTNPAGLVSCAVRVWQFAHGSWFQITGTARWEEFAPLKTVWVDNQPTDQKALDRTGRWGDMPFLMLAKCAEAQAIRKGWPEDLSNAFVGEEVDHASLQKHPADAAAEGATLERLQRINAVNTLTIDWLDDAPLDAVPIGQLADRIVGFLKAKRDKPVDLDLWRDRNRHALREFWARAPADALGVKREIETEMQKRPIE